MDDREWAARWVSGQSLRDYEDDCASDAEIAEAVRVKFRDYPCSLDVSGECAMVWIDRGPDAFIAAVREVVDDR